MTLFLGVYFSSGHSVYDGTYGIPHCAHIKNRFPPVTKYKRAGFMPQTVIVWANALLEKIYVWLVG